MSRRLVTQFSDMSVDEKPNATTNQELSDRKIKQEDSDDACSSITIKKKRPRNGTVHNPRRSERLIDRAIKKGEDGEKKRPRHTSTYDSYRPGRVSAGGSWISVGGSAPPHIDRDAAGYDWDQATVVAKTKASELHIVEIPTDQAARVMKDGELTSIFHIIWNDPIQDFIVYDGLEVLARVQDPDLEDVVYALASLHIGRQLGWARPSDYTLDVSIVEMKGRLAGGFAVRMSPPEEALEEGPSRKKRARMTTA